MRKEKKALLCFTKGYTLREEHEHLLHIQAALLIPAYPGYTELSGEMMTH